MEIIRQIVSSVSEDLQVQIQFEWIVITAPTDEGRWGPKARYWLNALNNGTWYSVPSTTKVEVRGFAIDDLPSRNSLEWMQNYFKENFRMSNVPMG
jgi:hypothetical protein